MAAHRFNKYTVHILLARTFLHLEKPADPPRTCLTLAFMGLLFWMLEPIPNKQIVPRFADEMESIIGTMACEVNVKLVSKRKDHEGSNKVGGLQGKSKNSFFLAWGLAEKTRRVSTAWPGPPVGRPTAPTAPREPPMDALEEVRRQRAAQWQEQVEQKEAEEPEEPEVPASGGETVAFVD